MNLEIYQQLCAESKILWTQHCLQRMQERDISRADVKMELQPVNGRILHIVAGCDNINIYHNSVLSRYKEI